MSSIAGVIQSYYLTGQLLHLLIEFLAETFGIHQQHIYSLPIYSSSHVIGFIMLDCLCVSGGSLRQKANTRVPATEKQPAKIQGLASSDSLQQTGFVASCCECPYNKQRQPSKCQH